MRFSKLEPTKPRGLALAAALAVAVALGLAASANAERPGWYANPGLSGTPQVGATLVAHFGGIKCEPNCKGTAYEWLSCTGAGSAGADRPTGGLPFDGKPAPGCVTRVPFPGKGENEPKYVPTQEDVGRHIQLHMTATNHDCGEVNQSSGTQECNDSTGHAFTNTVGPITGAAPAAPVAPAAPAAVLPLNTAPPAISGTPQVSQTLKVSQGTWTGTPPITYTFQWFRCSTQLKGCQAISGATKDTYTLVADDVAARITATVTAKNAGGQRAFTARLTAHVKPAGAATAAPTAGQRVVDVKSLTPAHRLVVGSVAAPKTVAPSSTAVVQVQVKDRRGFLIKGAWVELTGVRGEVGSVTEVTGANGSAVLRVKVGPLPDGHQLQLTVTALKPGANPISAVKRITITVNAG